MTYVYIAAPFSERDMACGVMRDLEAAPGFAVTSTWLREHDELADAYARLDLADVGRAHVLVALNPETWINSGTGGRHVEFGYALALGKKLVLVGPRSNIFHYLNNVVVLDTYDATALRVAIQAVMA